MKAYLNSEDVNRLEEAATTQRDRLLVRMLFHLGCRISELLAIRTENIDFAAGTVSILHLKSRIRLSCPMCKAGLGRTHHFCPKCGNEVGKALMKLQELRRLRTLPLDEGTLQMLAGFVKTQAVNGLVFGIIRHRAWQIVSRCAKRAGISGLVNPDTGKPRGVSPHRLRDAFAVHAMKLDDSGDGLRLLQEHLGHAGFNTTARYRKIAGSEHREWYQSLWGKSPTAG